MLNNQKELILLEDLGMCYATSKSKYRRRFGLYKCHCGVEFRTQVQLIKSKHTKSCGCLIGKRGITHGLTKHRLFKMWTSMMARCYNLKAKNYSSYGGRGITVCDEWHNVEIFINDMYPSYVEGLTLDREDNDKGYSAFNCRWTTKAIQSRNTRILRSTNTSGYRGASWNNIRNMFESSITVNSKKIHLGFFKIAIEAAKAYDKYIANNNLEHTKNF